MQIGVLCEAIPGSPAMPDMDEEHVLVFHPHWKPLLWPVVALVIVAEVLIPPGKGVGAERLAAIVASVPLIWWLIYSLLRWRTTRYEVTARRMRIRTGIFARTGRDIPLSAVTSVSFRKGLLDKFLGCGTLVVSAGEDGELALPEVPHVERVRSTLSDMAKNERLRLGETTG
jgi:uncharacterized membrane protein YdbT with pleckstrin-like domain